MDVIDRMFSILIILLMSFFFEHAQPGSNGTYDTWLSSGRCSAPKRSASRRLDCKKTAAVRGFRRWFDATRGKGHIFSKPINQIELLLLIRTTIPFFTFFFGGYILIN